MSINNTVMLAYWLTSLITTNSVCAVILSYVQCEHVSRLDQINTVNCNMYIFCSTCHLETFIIVSTDARKTIW